MKVGRLNVWSVCGLFDIVTGPNCCGMMCCWVFIYLLFGGIMLYNTIFEEWGTATQIILWIMLSINTICFLMLCLGRTGIPPIILKKLRAREKTDDGIVDSEANKESLLPKTLNRICFRCEE